MDDDFVNSDNLSDEELLADAQRELDAFQAMLREEAMDRHPTRWVR